MSDDGAVRNEADSDNAGAPNGVAVVVVAVVGNGGGGGGSGGEQEEPRSEPDDGAGAGTVADADAVADAGTVADAEPVAAADVVASAPDAEDGDANIEDGAIAIEADADTDDEGDDEEDDDEEEEDDEDRGPIVGFRDVRCPVCRKRYRHIIIPPASRSNNEDDDDDDDPDIDDVRVEDICSHDARLVYCSGQQCPICLEDAVVPPVVALRCGHVVWYVSFAIFEPVRPPHSAGLSRTLTSLHRVLSVHTTKNNEIKSRRLGADGRQAGTARHDDGARRRERSTPADPGRDSTV